MKYLLGLSVLAVCLVGCSSNDGAEAQSNTPAPKQEVPVNSNVPSDAKGVINKVAAPPPTTKTGSGN